MAELVVSNPHAVEIELQESPRFSEDHETGAPWQGYSSGYATGSETRSPRTRHRIRRGSASRGSSQRGNAVWPPQAEFDLQASPDHGASQHHPLTGQLEPLQRRLPKPLLMTLRRVQSLDPTTRRQLTEADELLSQAKYAEAIPYLETGLMGANRHPELQSLLWTQLGNCQAAVGDYKKASVCHMHHLAFCRELQDFAGMTRAECNLGIAYMKLGLLKLAGRCFLQYLENSQLLQDEPNIASAYSNLGMLSKVLAIHSFQSAVKEDAEGDRTQAHEILKTHLSRAITYFEHHLEIVEQQGNLEKQGRVYGCLGSCYEMLRQFPQAIFCHNKRLEMARRVGDRRSECCALCNLGNCFRASGKLQEAMEYYLLNLELTRATNDVSGEKVSVLNLGTTCELLNSLDKAIEWHTLYLGMTVKTRDLNGQARAFSTLAGLYEETRQLTKAHEFYWNLVKVFQQMGDRDARMAAAAYLEQVKAAMEREKLRQQKAKKHSKNKAKKTKSTPHTVSKASGFREPRSKVPRNRMGTWSYSQGSNTQQQQLQHQNLYTHRESPLSSHRHRGSHNRQASVTSSLIFHNPSAYERSQLASSQEFLTLATQPERVYRSQPVSQSLLEHETSVEVHPEGGHYPEELRPFYYLGDVMNEQRGPSVSPEVCPLSDLPCGEFSEQDIHLASESVTDCETAVDGHQHPSTGQVLGSLRHRQELQRMSQDFTQPVSELDLEGADKEWEQWLHIRRTTDFENDPLSNVGSMNVSSVQRSRTMPVGGVGKTNFSAPELDRFELNNSDSLSMSSGTLTP